MYAVLALCLIGIVVAQQPQPCTTPQQWEATFFDINESQRVFVRGRLSYDATYHRERLIEEVGVGRDGKFYDVIALFDSKLEFIIDLRTNNCTRQPLTRAWRDFGIRANATSLGEAYIGSSAVPGANVLATLWGGNHTGQQNDTVRTFGVWTLQSCLPVRHISHSSKFGRTEIQFYDITAGISNPSVFIPPSHCLTAEEYAMRDALFGAHPTKKIHQ